MATKKARSKGASSQKRSSSGSDPKSRKTVQKKMRRTMHEFKTHELESGSGQKVTNPKQAIAIGLSEARQSGAKIPQNPNQRKGAVKKGAAKKTAGAKSQRRRNIIGLFTKPVAKKKPA